MIHLGIREFDANVVHDERQRTGAALDYHADRVASVGLDRFHGDGRGYFPSHSMLCCVTQTAPSLVIVMLPPKNRRELYASMSTSKKSKPL